jgi:hypothetical protein
MLGVEGVGVFFGTQAGEVYKVTNSGAFFFFNPTLTLMMHVGHGVPVRSLTYVQADGTIFVGTDDGYFTEIVPPQS